MVSAQDLNYFYRETTFLLARISGNGMHEPIELLAPGGDADAIKAAIVAGASAVYCGLPSFNARNRAGNLSITELKDVVLCAHEKRCRIYVTLNTIILEDELDEVISLAKEIQLIGVDAVIVQDLGLLHLLHRHFPGMELHASTQCTTHNIGQIDFLSNLGVRQVNLARELSLEEIADVTRHAHGAGMKTEVFVHGAFCVSFSGQCYMSQVMSGHSGNRGACVQPCRREYLRSPGDRGGTPSETLLPFNLRDNSVFGEADRLLQSGVDSLKIEGRIKNFQYVYTTVTAWRAQIDRFLSGGSVKKSDPSLETVFNRSFTNGYIKGRIGKEMFIGTSRDQSLVRVGSVASYSADDRLLRLDQHEALPADTSILIYTRDFSFVCTGVVTERTAQNRYRFSIEHKLKGRIAAGQQVYRLADTGRMERIRAEISTLSAQKTPISIAVSGRAGEFLEASFSTPDRTVTVKSEAALFVAQARSLTLEQLYDKLGRLGDTQFNLGKVSADKLERGLFIPVSELNELRRAGVRMLMGVEANSKEIVLPAFAGRGTRRFAPPRRGYLVSDESRLPKDVEPGALMLFELPVNCGDFSDRLAVVFKDNPAWIPWFPAILIGPHFAQAVRFLEALPFKTIVTDNTGIGMEAGKRGIRWIAGPLVNVANSFACRCLSEYPHCRGAFVSPELDAAQINALAPPDDFELWHTLSGPRFLMNTRQCLIRNVGGCGKEVVDQACLGSCNRRETVYDSRGTAYHIVKRPGQYNRVYYGQRLDNERSLRSITQPLAGVVIDCRRV